MFFIPAIALKILYIPKLGNMFDFPFNATKYFITNIETALAMNPHWCQMKYAISSKV